MADNINIENGKASFFSARKAAWHGLGTVVETAQTWSEAMKLANLDWQVEKRQLLDPITHNEINAYGTFRSDNGAFLGAVGASYTPIQNQFQFDFVDTLLSAKGGAHYETAGALGAGERVWCLANIATQRDVLGTGDIHNYYLLFSNSHDGTTAARVMITDTRVVCQNTLNIALRRGGVNQSQISIKHTKNAETRLFEANKLLSSAIESIDDLHKKFELLAERKVTGKTLGAILGRLYNIDDLSQKLKGTTGASIESILERYEYNDNNAFPEFRGTAYNLLNAITEHTDHFADYKKTNSRKGLTPDEIRASSALFNGGNDFKNDALEVILQETVSAPVQSIARFHAVTNGSNTQRDLKSVDTSSNAALLDSLL